MTHSDDDRESAVQGAVHSADAPETAATVQAGARRAYSVTPAPGGELEPAGVSVTEGEIVTGFYAALDSVRGKYDKIQRGASLAHVQPSSLAQARERHHYAAGHFDGWLFSVPRLAYGYLHLAVKAVLHVLDWVIESPARLLVAVAVIAICWFWL